MREKPANEQAVKKLIDFLQMVKFIANGNPPKVNYKSLQESEGVAKRTASDCKALGIFEYDKEGNTKWLTKGVIDFRILALKVLDYRLSKTKKKIHVPIPDFAAFGEVLKTVADRLAHITLQQEAWLKRVKTGQHEDLPTVDQVNQHHLFEQQQQRQKDRVYIAGKLASGMYSSDFYSGDTPDLHIRMINERVIFATDDLLDKLYS